jgi:prepilin peptidase CpaA
LLELLRYQEWLLSGGEQDPPAAHAAGGFILPVRALKNLEFRCFGLRGVYGYACTMSVIGPERSANLQVCIVFETLILMIFPAAMVIAAVSDLMTMKISNWISIALVLAFCTLALWAGLGLALIGWHVAVGLAALIAGFMAFAFNWIGGGDAKLCAATALWLGPAAIGEYVILFALIGGGLTLVLLFARGIPLPAGLARRSWIVRLHGSQNGVPYGMALAAAGLIVYPQSVWMTAALS